jgi:hypothetical protein
VPLLIPTEREYASLLAAIKQRLRDGQYAALRAVNVELINVY